MFRSYVVDSLKQIKRILRLFALTAGLRVNFQKSCLYGINIPNSELEEAATVLGCKIGKGSVNYLGLNKATITAWMILKERVATKDNLTKRGSNFSPLEKLCPLCNKEEESTRHLFFNCETKPSRNCHYLRPRGLNKCHMEGQESGSTCLNRHRSRGQQARSRVAGFFVGREGKLVAPNLGCTQLAVGRRASNNFGEAVMPTLVFGRRDGGPE
ncbi:hypothetical protein ACS0TY_010388 [Phlomoides rotata]